MYYDNDICVGKPDTTASGFSIYDPINDILVKTLDTTVSDFSISSLNKWQNVNFPREKIVALAEQFWKEAGCPEGRSQEFWLKAILRLSATVGCGAYMIDNKVAAKQTAMDQFRRRKVFVAKHGQIDNSKLHAESPMYFYCKFCGVLVETLPEDYLFPAHDQCSQCKGLIEMGWLEEAMAAHVSEQERQKQIANYISLP